MSEFVVTRWARYGRDRLYVQTPDGVGLGYWGNKTGTADPADTPKNDPTPPQNDEGKINSDFRRSLSGLPSGAPGGGGGGGI
ncbi:MAG: hypothetical protein H7323_03995 [Frankiales bacterium]|nr:hypothetical protein [Frankiales bacterium]